MIRAEGDRRREKREKKTEKKIAFSIFFTRRENLTGANPSSIIKNSEFNYSFKLVIMSYDVRRESKE